MYPPNPYIPKKECCVYLMDKRASEYGSFFENVIYTKENPKILKGIDTHPDMNICHLGNRDIVVSKNMYEYYKPLLSEYGFNVIKGENEVSSAYPMDINLNCVIINNTLYHKLSHTDQAILKYAYEKNMKMVDVKQGYTKCSTLIVDEQSVITSDKGLFKKYEENGLQVLYVDNKEIILNNFDCGFIGGCGGLISHKKIAFFGKIEKLSDYNNIKEFIHKRNKEIISLSEEMLTDFGSIIPLVHI